MLVRCDMPTDDYKANMRATRNQLLAASDWTQVTDAPVDAAAWATYRQALRDLPTDSSWPFVQLPDPPNYNTGE